MTRRLAALPGVVALVMLIAACGGGDSTESTSSSIDEATTTTATAEDTTTTEGADTTTTTEAAEETTTTEAEEGTSTTTAIREDSLAGIVASDDRFTTLLAAVEAAGLTQRLADPDAELTVFAPTNEAFEAALEALGMTVEELLAAPDLADILAYHLLPEVVTAADILAAGTEAVIVDTVQGEPLTITITDGGEVRFLDAGGAVIEADINADNGVIHAIDVVLLPPSSDV